MFFYKKKTNLGLWSLCQKYNSGRFSRQFQLSPVCVSVIQRIQDVPRRFRPFWPRRDVTRRFPGNAGHAGANAGRLLPGPAGLAVDGAGAPPRQRRFHHGKLRKILN